MVDAMSAETLRFVAVDAEALEAAISVAVTLHSLSRVTEMLESQKPPGHIARVHVSAEGSLTVSWLPILSLAEVTE